MTAPPEANDHLDIGTVAERSGIPPSTLRLWEEKGLIAPVGRAGLRRQYEAHVLTTIAVIVVAQRSGFSLAEIARLLEPDAFSIDKQLLQEKLDELRVRRAELDAAIDGLEHALACAAPDPIECSTFTSLLANVLPRPDRPRPRR